MPDKSRFNVRNALILVVLTAFSAFLVGSLTLQVAPSQLPLIYQHVFEFSAVFLSGVIALLFFEGIIAKKDVYDDKEFLAYLVLFAVAYLLVAPLFDWTALTFFDRPATRLGILAAVEASAAILLTVVLERKTEVI